MGVNIEVLMDVELACLEVSEILVRLQATHLDVIDLWDSSFEIPVNAGLKALDTHRFKDEYTQNWSVLGRQGGNCIVNSVETNSIAFSLRGPYGFSAELFQDSIIFEHDTRWREFKDNVSFQERFIKTIGVFAKSLSSKQIYFLPDSSYSGSGCVEILSEGGKFKDVIDCLLVSGAHFTFFPEKTSDENSRIYILCDSKKIEHM
ncbi:hypothetical protein [Undibacterium sp. TS12]|uniref:hypothetical protein n=1 Tax=Undibacterium sp. TS12 TaxID=2908202 RepID=UPI001F4C783B|nr:hypothetical protein [Undibacterium sp. TS12]MCH8620496.1 hypothetical protein [Undibacterium sp. TS12]